MGQSAARSSEPLLQQRVEALRQPAAQPDTRDIEEAVAVDLTDIDLPHLAAGDGVGCTDQVHRHVEGSRQVAWKGTFAASSRALLSLADGREARCIRANHDGCAMQGERRPSISDRVLPRPKTESGSCVALNFAF